MRWVCSSLFLLTLIAGSAAAQTREPIPEDAAQALLSSFRATRSGVVFPVGPHYTSYYGAARVFDDDLPACTMPVLTMSQPQIGINDERGLSLVTVTRFVARNDSSAPIDRAEIERRCAAASVDGLWFHAPEGDLDAAIAAAWIASGAIIAMTEGRTAYEGVAIERDMAPSRQERAPAFEIFAPQIAEAVKSVSVRRPTPWEADGVVTLGTSGFTHGCEIEVRVRFTERIGDARVDRTVTAIDVGGVTCYVV